MALILQSPINFSGSLSSGTAASDLVQSLRSDFFGVSLKVLDSGSTSMRRKDFTVYAKIKRRKGKKREWPREPDPNLKGGILRHLSDFMPLKEKEKPKQLILQFEKCLLEAKKEINELAALAKKARVNIFDQLLILEYRYQKARLLQHKVLTPIQRVTIARHPQRPTFLDHIYNMTEKFVELHGDRVGYDDPAIVCGVGTIQGRQFMFIGQQKGRNTKENIHRNFGMPTPQGYRKALRLMKYAEHHGLPIVTFVDTPGAFADLKSERLNQGEAIAFNLKSMFGLTVPIVSIVMGEGGSGGALAIACANKLLMLENAVFYVASPEAAAAILYKSATQAPKAARKLRITARELCKLEIADGIIPEPLGGAHKDPQMQSEFMKQAILESMKELEKMDTEELLSHRLAKFRKLGVPKEPCPYLDPIKTLNFKPKDIPNPDIIVHKVLQGEVKKLRELVVNGNVSSVTHLEAKKVDRLNREMMQIVQYVIESSYDLTYKNDLLKLEVKRYERLRNVESRKKIIELVQEIKEGIAKALRSTVVKRKYDKLQAELREIVEETNGRLVKEPIYA